ncbi:MAG TPA: cupin domain-containing protein [Acidimicrobiales bacterium]|nr:cupin domain-containing protein [Acidimicrobiales bacterium]
MPEPLISSLDEAIAVETSWGRVAWLISGEVTEGAEQTFGIVTIATGHANPLHLHPNCEEVLYVLSGACEHRVGDLTVEMRPGQAICIPRGTPHQARTTSTEPLVVAVSFSSPNRQVVNLEDGDVA